MLVIGITGPTGAGKTTALHQLKALGGEIVDCDRVYHELLARDEELRRELTDHFGPVTDAQGAIDRKKLGGIVFGDPRALEQLNTIVYKYITRAVSQRLDRAAEQGVEVAAVDGITLVESGLARLCHTTLAVIAPAEERVRRICEREGITREYALARVAAQKDDAFFRANCEHVLVNDCATQAEFAFRAGRLFEELIAKHQQGGN